MFTDTYCTGYRWRNMSPHGEDQPSGEGGTAVKESFGSVAQSQGPAQRGGTQRPRLGLGHAHLEAARQAPRDSANYDHQGNIGNGTVPLLVLDVWEHAYYLQGT